MALELKGFGATAQRLARNPLGIIALFIVLVYGIAGLVLGLSSANLNPGQRWLLIGFLVLFPVIVLFVFYMLVTRHHTKLYAPRDFPEAEGFFRAMTPTEHKARLEMEIRELEDAPAAAHQEVTPAADSEGAEIISAVGLRHAWVLAEELAFREIESEFGAPIQRQVAYGSNHGVDGILVHRGKLTVVEIKYVHRRIWRPMIGKAIRHLERAQGAMKSAQAFILAIVADELPRERREAETEKAAALLASSSVKIELRVYDFQALKEKYGIASGGPSELD